MCFFRGLVINQPITFHDVQSRRVRRANQYVGDYTNPILKPEAAEIVRKHGEISLTGMPYPSPRNQCWPQGVPGIFPDTEIEMLQQPDRIRILYSEDHEIRHIRMNQPHQVPVTPSWYGDSVGHYEGDTLVIDTVGSELGHLRWWIFTARRTRRLCTSWNVIG